MPHMTLHNYRFLWMRDIANTGTTRVDLMPSAWTALGSSLIFGVSQTLIVTLVATPAAYALSRFAFAGRQNFLRGLLLLHAFPRWRSPSPSLSSFTIWACSTIFSVW